MDTQERKPKQASPQKGSVVDLKEFAPVIPWGRGKKLFRQLAAYFLDKCGMLFFLFPYFYSMYHMETFFYSYGGWKIPLSVKVLSYQPLYVIDNSLFTSYFNLCWLSTGEVSIRYQMRLSLNRIFETWFDFCYAVLVLVQLRGLRWSEAGQVLFYFGMQTPFRSI